MTRADLARTFGVEEELLIVDPATGAARAVATGALRATDHTDTGDDAVPASLGQAASEHLEDAAAVRGAALQRRLQHRELVVVGQQCRARRCSSAVDGVLVLGHGAQPKVGAVSVAPPEVEKVVEESFDVEVDKPWVTIVWNDPVNLMSYVSWVFQTYFGYSKEKAEQLMMAVHTEGRAVVSQGTRERMETDTAAMHGYSLWATFQKDE